MTYLRQLTTLLAATAAVVASGFALAQMPPTNPRDSTGAPPASGEQPAPATPSASRPSGTVGTALSDTAITTKVKAAFAADTTVSAMAIHVTTQKGEVQLSGTAKSAAEKQRAEELARTTEGVRNVRSRITVKP